MFSIEKNYLKEQNIIIHKLQKELKANQKEIESLTQRIKSSDSLLTEDISPYAVPDDGQFSDLDDIYTESITDSKMNEISEDQIDQLLGDSDEELPLDPELQRELDMPEDEPANDYSLNDLDIPETYKMYIPKTILSQVQELNPNHYYRGKRKFVTLLPIHNAEVNQLSKQLSPEAYVKISNKLFNQLFASIYKHGGVVSYYSGESLMAVFGLFDKDHPAHAKKAHSCVVELIHKLGSINEYLSEKELNRLNVCVGVHSGEVIVGKVGSIKGGDLLIMGDEVKVADAICLSSEQWEFAPVFSDKIKVILGDSVSFTPLKAISVPGRKKSIKTFRL